MTSVLVDGNNLLIRSFLAPKGDMAVDEIETGTLVLFVNSLARHVRNERPDCMLVAWDGGHSAYRKHLFEGYKASRTEKISDEPTAPFALVQEFLRLAGIPQLKLPGYEGDDLIAATWKATRRKDRIVILSNDKDMLQLIEEGTEQIRFGKASDPVDRWNHARVIAEIGCRPKQIPAMMSLTGDKIDSIPGLPRVGPKTALKMLNQSDWRLDRVLPTLTREQRQQVLINYSLVDLSEVPLELPPPPHLDLVMPGHAKWPELLAFCEKYQLNQILNRLNKKTLWF